MKETTVLTRDDLIVTNLKLAGLAATLALMAAYAFGPRPEQNNREAENCKNSEPVSLELKNSQPQGKYENFCPRLKPVEPK